MLPALAELMDQYKREDQYIRVYNKTYHGFSVIRGQSDPDTRKRNINSGWRHWGRLHGSRSI